LDRSDDIGAQSWDVGIDDDQSIGFDAGRRE
jgi:hypothetical protein